MNNARRLGEELEIKPGGRIQQRAGEVLEKAGTLLKEVAEIGLFAALERGYFADVKRSRDGGKGLQGVVLKAPGYCNPFEKAIDAELKGGI
jgi:beta-lysine 5,6-aminomutase alpha subunit